MLNDDFDQRFLIVGNGRSGSTWLLTSLNLLSDVSARQEMKWANESSVFVPDAHRLIDRTSSIKQVLDDMSIEFGIRKHSCGSKLIFDPYRYYGSGSFSNLSDATGAEVSLILLKRRYLGLWLSWKARGVYHELNEDGTPPPDRAVARDRRLARQGILAGSERED